MKRRLIKQGKDTLTISLPMTWVKRNKLKAGDAIHMTEREIDLLLSARKREDGFDLSLKLETDNAWYIGQIIRYCYLMDMQKIRLSFSLKSTMQVIRSETQKLIGFEIIEENNDFCVLKALTSALDDGFDTLLRKIFMKTLVMFSSLEDFNEVKRLNVSCQRFGLFCRKILLKEFDTLDKTSQYILIQRLTMISNNLLYASRHLSKENRKLSGLEKENVLFCSRMYQLFYDVFYAPDTTKLLELNEMRREFVEKIRSYKGSFFIQNYLWEIVRLLGSSGSLVLSGQKRK